MIKGESTLEDAHDQTKCMGKLNIEHFELLIISTSKQHSLNVREEESRVSGHDR
jgi:hypothetical protein